MASKRPEAIWRDGDRIASHWHGGFSDRVSDEQLETYATAADLHAEDRAFAAAVLAYRRFERVGYPTPTELPHSVDD